MTNFKEKLNKVRSFVFDYDGVLTDGTVLISENGTLLRKANMRDGYALKHAVEKGFLIAIISGAKTDSIRTRFEGLHVHDIYLGVENKLTAFNEFLNKHGLTSNDVLFMGDDIPDYPLMKESLVATCPNDAAEEIKAVADYISAYTGGSGCVRDIIEQVMRVQDVWFTP